LRAVKRRGLGIDAHVNQETVAQLFGRADQELGAPLDLAADVIRQAAVGERHVPAALDQHDLGIFVEPPRPGRGRGPARHSADNHQLHVLSGPPINFPEEYG
jgi:hypothetical protein